ncbi:hypothetical protein J6TS2_14840 [Heyndrickxia sporothermodurans]|nr:hypothetical protein J6TS2_14840 [Heyndrickxia sporothermodurans]
MKHWLSTWSIGQKGTINDFTIIKEAGFDGVEIWSEQLRAKEYMDFARQNDLEIGMHLPFHDLNLAAPDAVVYERVKTVLLEWMERLAKYGGHHATIHGGYAWSSEEREETLLRVAERLQFLHEKSQSFNVELQLENLIPDKLNYCHHIASNVSEWINLLKETHVKACLDIGHLAVMGNDIEDTILKLGNSLSVIHLSDNDRKSDLHLLPGEGEDIGAELSGLLQKSSFNGPIVYEINPYKYSLQEIVNYFSKLKETKTNV